MKKKMKVFKNKDIEKKENNNIDFGDVCFAGAAFFALINIIDTIIYFLKSGVWSWDWGLPRPFIFWSTLGAKFSLSSLFQFNYQHKETEWWIYAVLKDFICLYDLFWLFLVAGVLFKIFNNISNYNQ